MMEVDNHYSNYGVPVTNRFSFLEDDSNGEEEAPAPPENVGRQKNKNAKKMSKKATSVAARETVSEQALERAKPAPFSHKKVGDMKSEMTHREDKKKPGEMKSEAASREDKKKSGEMKSEPASRDVKKKSQGQGEAKQCEEEVDPWAEDVPAPAVPAVKIGGEKREVSGKVVSPLIRMEEVSTAVGDLSDNTPSAPPARLMTLDEYKDLQQTHEKPVFNTRKAGEGEENPLWKKMVLKKKKDVDIVEEIGGKPKHEVHEVEETKHYARQKKPAKTLDLNYQFPDSRRGFGGRGRGARGGGFGNGRGDTRDTTETPPPPRSYGYSQSYITNYATEIERNFQAVPKVDDESDFPALGGK